MTEESKYTSLLRHHRKLVWRLCLRYARYDSDRCADMVQEVCSLMNMNATLDQMADIVRIHPTLNEILDLTH